MTLQVIGTGSAGNSYVLQQGDDLLLLDAGLTYEKILSALPDGIRGLKACLITHEHQDHAKSAIKLLERGVRVVMSRGTWDAISNGRDPFAVGHPTIIKAGQSVYIPPFMIVAVKAAHDAAEPLGYLIRYDPTRETALYATDTYTLPNRYPGISHWLVECNYTMQAAENLFETGQERLYKRLMNSHMSLEHLCDSLRQNDLSATKKIVLLHISDERGDAELMQRTVEEITGITTVSAANGMDISLGECPF